MMVLLRVASSGDPYAIPSTTVSTVLSANFSIKQYASVWHHRLGYSSPKMLDILNSNKSIVRNIKHIKECLVWFWESPQDYRLTKLNIMLLNLFF